MTLCLNDLESSAVLLCLHQTPKPRLAHWGPQDRRASPGRSLNLAKRDSIQPPPPPETERAFRGGDEPLRPEGTDMNCGSYLHLMVRIRWSGFMRLQDTRVIVASA